MNTSHSIYTRSAQGLALLVAVTLLGGCVATDPEYGREITSARTDCKGNEIVGVWSCSTMGFSYLKASVLLLRPDGTGYCRNIYTNPKRQSKTEQIFWHYQGAGVWAVGAATLRFAGNALLWEGPSAEHGWAGAQYTSQLVFIRSGDESLNDIMKPNP